MKTILHTGTSARRPAAFKVSILFFALSFFAAFLAFVLMISTLSFFGGGPDPAEEFVLNLFLVLTPACYLTSFVAAVMAARKTRRWKWVVFVAAVPVILILLLASMP